MWLEVVKWPDSGCFQKQNQQELDSLNVECEKK